MSNDSRPTPPGGTELERALAECVEAVERKAALTTDSAARKAIPIVSGCIDYFPAALAAVARLSQVGNDKHNPGEPLHHARGKSMDHADCIVRHLLDRDTIDTDGIRHSVKVAWRALALLQEELEREEGAPLARGARAAEPLVIPFVPFTPKHSASCKDQNCDRSCMRHQRDDCADLTHCTAAPRALHCKSCGSQLGGQCQDC